MNEWMKEGMNEQQHCDYRVSRRVSLLEWITLLLPTSYDTIRYRIQQFIIHACV